MMETKTKTYVITVINTTNIILTAFCVYVIYGVDTYLFKGFMPPFGYLLFGYGLGFFLPPYLSYKLPLPETTTYNNVK